MPNASRTSAYLQALNEAGVRLEPTAHTGWMPQQTVIVAHDTTIPQAPGLIAKAALEAIDLAITKPPANTDGSPYLDHLQYEVFYGPSPGIDPDNPLTYTGSFVTTATRHTFATSSQQRFVAVACDRHGNRSARSSERTAVPVIPGFLVAVDDYPQNIETVAVGLGIVGIKFQPIKSSWTRWTGWKLCFNVNTGGGWTGIWTGLYEGPGPAFIHKGLNESHRYRYRLRVLGEEGRETVGTVADNAGVGFQPNAANQNALVAVDVFAERMIASKEMIARTIIGGTLQSTNLSTSLGSILDLDAGTIRLGGTTAPRFQVGADGALTATGATISGAITVGAGSSVPYGHVTGGPPINADNTATVINGGIVTTGTIQLQDGGGIVRAGITAAGTGDANVRIWAGDTHANRAVAPFRVTQAGAVVCANITITGGSVAGGVVGSGISADNVTAGILTGRIVRTAASGVRAEMNPGGEFGHQLVIYGSGANVSKLSVGAHPLRLSDGSNFTDIGLGAGGRVTVGHLQVLTSIWFPAVAGSWTWTGGFYTGGWGPVAKGIFIFDGATRYAIPIHGPV